MAKALRGLAAAYLLAVVITAVVYVGSDTNPPVLYLALWIMCLPTSLVAGPIYPVAASLAESLLSDSSLSRSVGWIFHVAWWASVAVVQITIARGVARVLAGIRGRNARGARE
jgi:hypothetical protein